MIRLLDSNINRVCEGLRVLEDISRFKYNFSAISKDLKDLRHSVRKAFKNGDEELLNSRDVNSDIGPAITNELDIKRDSDIKSLIVANFKRVQEGLRTLEEVSKTHLSENEASIYESGRYRSYNIEKQFISCVARSNFSLPPLYGITYHKDSLGRSNVEVVKEMIKAGIKLIQYREKDLSIKERLQECIEIRELTKEAGVFFIVNDHIDIAILVDADGVHIGQDDIPIEQVRSLVGDDKIIGLSTHSPDQAKKAVEDGADYIGVGPIFATQTKVNVCDPVGFSYLEWVNENIDIPYVAIGGIKEHNIRDILERGANSIALVSEITGNKDITNKVKGLMSIYKEYRDDI